MGLRRVIAAALLFSSTLCAEGIVTLAPHLTEWVYALKLEKQLVGVSDFSDYPEAARALPRVANHQGLNFEAIVRLQPDIILAWQGGNKPQDLSRLSSLGLSVVPVSIQRLADIPREITRIGNLLNRPVEAQELAAEFSLGLMALDRRMANMPPKRVFYYLWPRPLMSIGKDAWASELLARCKATNVFEHSPQPYPEVTLEAVIRARPEKIVAAQHIPRERLLAFWAPWQKLLKISSENIIALDPDPLHRYSPRLIKGLNLLCDQIHS